MQIEIFNRNIAIKDYLKVKMIKYSTVKYVIDLKASEITK